MGARLCDESQEALGSCPQTEPPSLPSPLESLLGREAPCLSLQRFSSTYSAALLRADTNQAPSKPSPRHQASLPQTHITTPLPSRLPMNFRILALGVFQTPSTWISPHTSSSVCDQESGSQDHQSSHPSASSRAPAPSLQCPPTSENPAPKSPRLPHSLLGRCRVSPARVAHLLFAEFQ